MGLKRLVGDSTPRLILEGARDHNLKDITVEFPLLHLVCVTGVSGSGKSTLIQDILAPALARHFGKATETPGAHDALHGADWLGDTVFVDQSPIGKTARSNPASYVGAFDEIRKLFALEPLAVQRSYGAGMFSFNAGNGRCPTCGGSGFEHVEMQFLSDVYLRCPDCDGRRFRAEILDVTIERRLPGDVSRSLSVADVLELTVAEAVQLFRDDREVVRRLQPIVDVGLEYVKLGQPVPTLSGGEAQRLKLAGFLAEAAQNASASRQALARRGTLFMFDEPTTGLHFDDIAKLMRSFRKLARGGPLDRRHRAQPRRHPRLRLADRPRPRRRRGRRRAGRLRHAGGREAPRQLAHRQGAARLRRRARLRGPCGRGGAAAAAACSSRCASAAPRTRTSASSTPASTT